MYYYTEHYGEPLGSDCFVCTMNVFEHTIGCYFYHPLNFVLPFYFKGCTKYIIFPSKWEADLLHLHYYLSLIQLFHPLVTYSETEHQYVCSKALSLLFSISAPKMSLVYLGGPYLLRSIRLVMLPWWWIWMKRANTFLNVRFNSCCELWQPGCWIEKEIYCRTHSFTVYTSDCVP